MKPPNSSQKVSLLFDVERSVSDSAAICNCICCTFTKTDWSCQLDHFLTQSNPPCASYLSSPHLTSHDSLQPAIIHRCPLLAFILDPQKGSSCRGLYIYICLVYSIYFIVCELCCAHANRRIHISLDKNMVVHLL